MKPVRSVQIPLVEHNLEIGKFIFYPNIIITKYNEGVHVNFENILFPIQLIEKFYGNDTPFVYISDRQNSYSIHPFIYTEIATLFPNFIATAVVANNNRRRMLVKLERSFLKRPIDVFYEIEPAIKWSEKVLKKHT